MSIPADRSRLWEEGCTSTRVRSASSSPLSRLTDDLLVEILSRVPAKSLCRCKCVSKHWISLINHPDHRKKLPQTLAGFFYSSTSVERLPKLDLHFTNVSGRQPPLICPSLSFLPNHRRLDLLDCCNGLILCRLYDVSTTRDDEFRYIVSNPATEEWVTLPEPSHAGKVAAVRLGFDPAVSSHFHVFVLLVVGGDHWRPRLTGVDFYSSETGRWVHKEKGWNGDIRLANGLLATVFANGRLHFHTFDRQLRHCVATVDTHGETWANFRVPGGLDNGFIQQSQVCLHYANFQRDSGDRAVIRLVIFVLEDYDSKEWILRHSVEASLALGWMPDFFNLNFHWIAIHPDCNLIFFTPSRATCFLCYNMDCRQVKVIAEIGSSMPPFLPYMPFYSKLQSLNI